MEQDRQATPLNLFPQLETKGMIGSVHTSAVRLRVTESTLSLDNTSDFEEFYLPQTKREVASCRRNMKICGGQAYLPILKSNTLIEQRTNVEKLGHLPLLLQRLLTSPRGSFDQNKSIIREELVSKFQTLEYLLADSSMEWINSGKNTVRFEFFVTSNLRNRACDITLPVPDPWDLLLVVDHTEFRTHWSHYSDVYMEPLRNFVQDLKKTATNQKSFQPEKMCPEIRTCLVFCCEKCVEAVNIMGFQGRIIQMVWKELSHGRYQHENFLIPATVLVKILDPGMRAYGLYRPPICQPTPAAAVDSSSEEELASGKYSYPPLFNCFLGPFSYICFSLPVVPLTAEPCSNQWEYYGVCPLVLPIVRYEPGRLVERELRSPPPFLQATAGRLYNLLHLPFAYFRHCSRMHVLTLAYSDLDRQPGFYGSFEGPNYAALADLPPCEVRRFQESIIDILWEAYDNEWWFIIKSRAYHRHRNTKWEGFPAVDTTLQNFPCTVNSYKEWSRPQAADPLLKTSTKFANGISEVKDLGTYWAQISLGPNYVGTLICLLTFIFDPPRFLLHDLLFSDSKLPWYFIT
jgi:hypothetical protein